MAQQNFKRQKKDKTKITTQRENEGESKGDLNLVTQ